MNVHTVPTVSFQVIQFERASLFCLSDCDLPESLGSLDMFPVIFQMCSCVLLLLLFCVTESDLLQTHILSHCLQLPVYKLY